MATENELLIKINADAKNAEKAFDDVKSKTADLENQLSKVAKISAVAFAAFTAEILLSAKAFDDAERASRELTNSLQNQGIFTEELAESYKRYAAEIQKATGYDDDAIIASQALAQSYLGQTVITKELTQAIADYAAFKKIDLNQSAELLSKSIGTETNALARQGLQFSATATEAEKYQKVIEFVQLKAGGLAEAANQGLGGLRGLQAAFGDFQEEIGKNFQPALAGLISTFTKLFQFINENPAIAKIAAAFIVAGTAVAALGVAIPVVVSAITTMTAAMAFFGVTSNIALAGIPALIALIVGGITLVILNFSKIRQFFIEIGAAMTAFFAGFGEGLKLLAQGVADGFDTKKMMEGIQRMRDASIDAKQAELRAQSEFYQKQTAEAQKTLQVQDADKKAFADKEVEDKRNKQGLLRQIELNNIEIIRLTNENASQALIDLKQKENAVLKSLTEEKSAEEKALLQIRYEQLVEQENEHRAQDLERHAAWKAEDDAAKDELEAAQQNSDVQLTDQQLRQLENKVMTEKEIEQKALIEMETKRIEARNREIEMRKKYGVVIAEMDRILNSTQVEGAKTLSGELVALSQSRNATLKTIGKAAAISQITIATAESATNVAKSVFAVLPFPINVPVAAALAAARIAFGAEQISNVIGAADGGLIRGGIPGVDSVPALLQDKELVAPASSFEEVVGGVQNFRNSRDDEIVEILEDIRDGGTKGNTFVFQGDVLADDFFIERVARALSDGIEFKNLKIVGVNA